MTPPAEEPREASDELEWDESGEMKPTLPEPIAKALAHFRAMSEPYYSYAMLNDAEHQLRLAILKHETARCHFSDHHAVPPTSAQGG